MMDEERAIKNAETYIGENFEITRQDAFEDYYECSFPDLSDCFYSGAEWGYGEGYEDAVEDAVDWIRDRFSDLKIDGIEDLVDDFRETTRR